MEEVEPGQSTVIDEDQDSCEQIRLGSTTYLFNSAGDKPAPDIVQMQIESGPNHNHPHSKDGDTSTAISHHYPAGVGLSKNFVSTERPSSSGMRSANHMSHSYSMRGGPAFLALVPEDARFNSLTNLDGTGRTNNINIIPKNSTFRNSGGVPLSKP